MDNSLNNIRVGIVGQGFVGSSIKNFFENKIQLFTYDLNGKCNCGSLDELVHNSELIFICLPTPMMKDGSCDLSIVENTLQEIFAIDNKKIIILKSTILPGTTDTLINQFGSSIVFNPEFLTEANAVEDFKNQDRIIVGGYGSSLNKVKSFFQHFFTKSIVVSCNPKEAELTKYVTNTFLTTKVAFANEISTLCKSLDVDYESLIEIFTLDKRLGDSHWSVPGPDGKKGFGGSCFPKDINALISLFNQFEVDSPLLNAVWDRNVKIDRPEQDWNDLIGRAVSYDSSKDD